MNTGWLGFVRVDYKNGDNIDGWTGNAGLRYQFTPETIAAIMPRKAPVKAMGHVITPTNWTGFYAGGFLGADYGSTSVGFVGTATSNNPRVAGALGGVEAGYNYQFANRVVLGIEGDVGATNMQGSRTCTPFSNQPNFLQAAFLNCQNSSDWMATVAARLGYAWGRTLFYVKGGGAWENDKVNVSCIFGPLNNTLSTGGFTFGPCTNPAGAVTNGFSNSGNRAGWLIGYGTEFDLGKNWSAKAEWDYINFGSRDGLANDGTTVIRDLGSINQVKIGVNYRFSGPGVVVARY